VRFNPGDIENEAQHAVQYYWASRRAAGKKNAEGDRVDQGLRGEATGGQALNQFVNVMQWLVEQSGFTGAQVGLRRGAIALPGYYRPSKQWDLVVTHEGDIVAAIEFKSHMGIKDLGKNYNNRKEEAIGSATDFWASWRSLKYGEDQRPFLGWFILVQESHESTRPLRPRVSYGSVDPQFKSASFLERYDLLCRRVAEDGLYTAAGVMGIREEDAETGYYSDVSADTSFIRFCENFYAYLVHRAG
jgi:hypothetical protein